MSDHTEEHSPREDQSVSRRTFLRELGTGGGTVGLPTVRNAGTRESQNLVGLSEIFSSERRSLVLPPQAFLIELLLMPPPIQHMGLTLQ